MQNNTNLDERLKYFTIPALLGWLVNLAILLSLDVNKSQISEITPQYRQLVILVGFCGVLIHGLSAMFLFLGLITNVKPHSRVWFVFYGLFAGYINIIVIIVGLMKLGLVYLFGPIVTKLFVEKV